MELLELAKLDKRKYLSEIKKLDREQTKKIIRRWLAQGKRRSCSSIIIDYLKLSLKTVQKFQMQGGARHRTAAYKVVCEDARPKATTAAEWTFQQFSSYSPWAGCTPPSTSPFPFIILLSFHQMQQ